MQYDCDLVDRLRIIDELAGDRSANRGEDEVAKLLIAGATGLTRKPLRLLSQLE
jgi:hypothetical protein